MIEIYVNDQSHSLPEGVTLAELVQQLAADVSIVAAVNDIFVPRTRHSAHVLQSGDRVELLSPMEGG